MYRTFRGAKQLGIVAGALMLSACATAAQRQYQAIATSNQSLVGQAKACVAAIYAAPEAAPLRPHITIDPRDLTLAQLSDQSLATKEEIEAIFILHPRLQQCRKGVLDGLVTTTPTIVPILAAEYIRGDDLTLLLVQRKLSWGEFSK